MNNYCYYTHLQNIPAKLYRIILGQKWFRTEWKPSKHLVWDSGDTCLIPLINLEMVKAAWNFSYARESAINQARNLSFWSLYLGLFQPILG